MSDFTLSMHGSIALLRPLTDGAVTWCGEYLPHDCPRWAGAYAIEARFVPEIAGGIRRDGFTLESEW